jgi:Pyruvate/2-oxoacid:ferredoxin oxidoreductase gamma subunit
MEREIGLTGIGGQGVQLAAQTLARGAAHEGRNVSLFGVYSGSMRGGRTDSSIVVADGPIDAPPLVSHLWSVIAMHDAFWLPNVEGRGVEVKLQPGSVVLRNSSTFDTDLDRDTFRVFDVAATEIALGLGNEMMGSMVMVGALAGITGLLDVESALEGMRQSVPPHRTQHIERNEAAIRAGFETVADRRLAAPAWSDEHEEVRA